MGTNQFYSNNGQLFCDRYDHRQKNRKRFRTEEEQKFVDWYEFTEDYGFHKDLTPADHKRYNWIVKHTVWKPFNRQEVTMFLFKVLVCIMLSLLSIAIISVLIYGVIIVWKTIIDLFHED